MESLKSIVDAFARPRTLEWPDAEPPKPGESMVGCNMNGRQYMKKEVSPGRWQWVINEEAENYLAAREKERRDLFWALRTRVLTLDEMDEVKRYGKYLNVGNNEIYSQADKDAELNAALLQQFNLRLALERHTVNPSSR